MQILNQRLKTDSATSAALAPNAVRSAYVIGFVECVSNIAFSAVADRMARRGIDVTTDDVESLWEAADAIRQKLEADASLGEIAKRVHRASDVYAKAAAELTDRLERELAVGRLHRVSHVKVLGDMHMRGAVALLYSDGSPLSVYKPRPMAVDIVFSRLLDHVRESVPESVPMHPDTRDLGEYGFQDFVAYSSPPDGAERSDFFRRFGGLAAIAYALSMSDLHRENVICAGSSPAVVDAECLFNYDPRLELYPDSGRLIRPPATVLTPMLLPNWIKQFDSAEAFDISALGSYKHPERSAPERILTFENGVPRYTYKRPEAAVAYGNLPQSEDETFPAAGYEVDLLEGFDQLAEVLAQHKTKAAIHRIIESVDGIRSRFISTDTSVYATRLQGTSRFSVTENLRQSRLGAWVNECEAEALNAGVIPLFERNFRAATIISDTGADHQTSSTPQRQLAVRLGSLNAQEFAAQRKLVERALDLGSANPGNTKKMDGRTAGDSVGPQIARIVDLLERNAQSYGDTLWWPTSLEHDPERWQLDVTGAALYDGQAGIVFALGVAALESRRAESLYLRCRDNLAQVVGESVSRHRSEGFPVTLGLSDGPLGPLVALASVASLHADHETLQWVSQMGSHLELNSQFPDDWEYMSGLAGTAVGLQRLGDLTQYSGFRALEDAALDSLSSQITRAAPSGNLRAGLAHGLSGVALAFASASSLTDAERDEAARTCIEAEDALLLELASEQEHSHSTRRVFSSSWCWGSAGQLLVRLKSGGSGGNLTKLRTRTNHHDPDFASVCHGSLGTVMVQGTAEYESMFGVEDARQTAAMIDTHLASNFAPRRGAPAYTFDPGLFTGLSGLLVYLASRRDGAHFDVTTLSYGQRVAN
ncbi:DUF4135 domain-containing protein [Agromyces sp. Root81]|uniref:DUF4135 domain-containing protein n=1 Tax=Agromyces sp. Root81 TaxID=1736601 RepID=UPI00138EF417|nr:DUF4135 domain-containing protein [Agromyces sp. Root81]